MTSNRPTERRSRTNSLFCWRESENRIDLWNRTFPWRVVDPELWRAPSAAPNRESRAEPSSALRSYQAESSPERAHLLERPHDDPFVGFEAAFDHAQAIVLKRTRRDAALLCAILGIDDIDIFQSLIGAEMARSITRTDRWGSPSGIRTRTNMPGESSQAPCSGLGLAKMPRTEMLPVVELT